MLAFVQSVIFNRTPSVVEVVTVLNTPKSAIRLVIYAIHTQERHTTNAPMFVPNIANLNVNVDNDQKLK